VKFLKRLNLEGNKKKDLVDWKRLPIFVRNQLKTIINSNLKKQKLWERF